MLSERAADGTSPTWSRYARKVVVSAVPCAVSYSPRRGPGGAGGRGSAPPAGARRARFLLSQGCGPAVGAVFVERTEDFPLRWSCLLLARRFAPAMCAGDNSSRRPSCWTTKCPGHPASTYRSRPASALPAEYAITTTPSTPTICGCTYSAYAIIVKARKEPTQAIPEGLSHAARTPRPGHRGLRDDSAECGLTPRSSSGIKVPVSFRGGVRSSGTSGVLGKFARASSTSSRTPDVRHLWSCPWTAR